MLEWIQGSDIRLPERELQDFEFLELVKQGLQPHHRYKREQLFEPWDLINKVIEDRLFSRQMYTDQGYVNYGLIERKREEYASLYHNDELTWQIFLLNLEKQVYKICDFTTVIAELRAAIYKEEEVIAYVRSTSPNLLPNEKVTHSQRHRKEARRLAANEWKKKPGKSLTEMVRYIQSLPRNPFDGEEYKDDTITEWIRDLNPAYTRRCPGRKRKIPAE